MNRTTTYLAGLALAGIVLVIAAAAVPRTRRPPNAATATISPVPDPASAPAQTAVPVAPEPLPVNIPPLPADATTVPDEDLLKLSALVDLANTPDQPIDKQRWARAVPVAEKLVQGPCDCEQRNWLNHFIAMGEAAHAGEDDQYHQLAGLMVKLARNDKQLAEDPVRSLR